MDFWEGLGGGAGCCQEKEEGREMHFGGWRRGSKGQRGGREEGGEPRVSGHEGHSALGGLDRRSGDKQQRENILRLQLRLGTENETETETDLQYR